MDVTLLQQFYTQACEHPLATEVSDTQFTYEQQEYDQYMIELRKMIRFFLELESRA